MRHSRFVAVIAALLTCCAISCAALGETPSTMIKIVVRMTSPEIPPGSFAAQPRTLYRATDKYGRVEEAVDAEHGVQELIIVSEPDAWIINVLQKAGQHAVDPGPPVFHAYVFEGDSSGPAPDALQGLEMGREVSFFTAHGAKVDGDARELTFGDLQIRLELNHATRKPARLTVTRGKEVELTMIYDSYEDARPFDASLFKPPRGVAIQEAKKE